MRRFLTLALLVCFSVPFGVSVVGCGHKTATVYCNGGDSGPVVGQVDTISLSPNFAVYGESLDYAQIGSSLSATALDCKGNTVSVLKYTYASSDQTFADINPATGAVCGGQYNRFSGGGVADYTSCIAPVSVPVGAVAYVTATADGAVSNAIPVYIHPKVTSVVIGLPTANCATDPDPATNCCPLTTGAVVTAPAYTGGSCLSQGSTAQITARVYANGTTNAADNITCKVGHLQYSAQNSSVFTIDQNGVATAAQPGSSVVSASVTNSAAGGAAGFWSTCPPASIALTASSQSNPMAATVQVGTTQPLVATVLDTKGVPLTGIALTFSSTQSATIPAGTGTVSPAFPGAATITATCQPPTCNTSPFTQLGLYGNGVPITSNGVQITTPGSNASVLYIGSTNSQYVLPIDFSTNQTGSLIKLPYTPNSMVISLDGSTIFFGSTTALMTISTASNGVGAAVLGAPGVVLAASPDGTSIVITDPTRKTVSLASAAGVITTSYGGVGTAAKYSPDGQTVYVAAGNQVLVHSNFTGWTAHAATTLNYNDVAVMVPSIGAYFATSTTDTQALTYCPTTTVSGTGNPPVTTNVYYPIADDAMVQVDKIAATNDGLHMLGATATTSAPTLQDIKLTIPAAALACTNSNTAVKFTSAPAAHPLSSITAQTITGVVPSSTSSLAFVTYTGTSGLLPLYIPATGATNYVSLTGGATLAPVAGVFSTDNSTFYAGTSGDNQVHLITVTGTTATDTSVIAPKLPDANNNIAVPNLLSQRVKKATS